MTTRRQLLLASAIGALAPCVCFSQIRKVPRVGILHAGSSKEPLAVQREPFERGLRELGWLPGSTVLIDYRYAEGDRNNLPRLARELVKADVDVIVARADDAIRAARAATSTIPIVMAAYIGDAAAEGLVKNLSRPGGNITGIGNFPELDDKRLEILRDAFPKLQRLAVISNPGVDSAQGAGRIKRLIASGAALKMQLQVFEVTRADQLEDVFAAIGANRAEAILVRGDPEVLDGQRVHIAAQAAKLRLPTMYWWRFMVEAGGLMSYGNSIPGLHHRSATYIDRILKGARPGDLAIEQPTKIEFILNARTAKAIGVELPKALVFRADEIIE